MDARNALFGKGPRSGMPGLPGRKVQSGGGNPGGYSQAPPPPARDYGNAPADYNDQGSYGAPSPGYGNARSPGFSRQPERLSGGYSAAPSRAVPLQVEKLPSSHPYIFQNLSAVSPNDFKSRDGVDQVYILLKGPNMRGDFVITARPTPGFPDRKISLTDAQRTWCGISLTDQFTGEIYDPFSQGKKVYLGTMDLEIAFASARKQTDVPYDQDTLSEYVAKTFPNQILSPGQRFIMDLQGIPISLGVKTISLVDLTMEKGGTSDSPTTSDPSARGILTNVTIINFFKDSQSPIKLKGSARRPATNAILRPDFKFENMGIGGLDDEFSTIFRRAFSSRLLPPGLIDQMGIPHVKGMLLYGPPGTGKTLIARQIGKMLNAREPKIINGPEILNKFVGQSEENVRKMFADAEKEYKEKGEESGLHIIIFDELDAVCKQRGSGGGGGTGVGDSVVNQLLTKLDGVEQLNNILLIGMTNRKDMIDDALLRPGRLEVHVEISLPDEAGRQQIFKIHTQKMRSNSRLEDDVNITELAARTKNFSGAEINGLVKAASSYAFTRQVKIGELSGPQVNYDEIKVSQEDFLRALDDVKPAFGVSEEDLEKAATHGIIRFSPHIERIQADGQFFAAQISHSEDEPIFSVLLHGPKGSGKTALAADIGLKSGFPFVKLVSAADMISMGEQAKIDHLRKIYQDAYKSPVSMIILDRIEMMIEWSPIGPRFQNSVLIAIAVLMAAKPPRNRRLLTVGTTSERSTLQQLNVLSFDRELAVPAVTSHKELAILLGAKGYNDPAEINEVMYELQNVVGSERIDLGVAVVLRTLGTAQLKASRDSRVSFASFFANELADVINTTLR